ncbi:MAG: 30S ribosomal protein S9 [Candidatus Paceibacterota bacterium]|jgi:small subunit ribosomal protein S9
MEKKTTTTKNTGEGRYVEAVGRRKTSIARVRMTESPKMSYVVNGKELEVYFPTAELRSVINDPFTEGKLPAKYFISVVVKGGGIHSQAEAVRHGISRILTKEDPESRTRLKKLGFLKRDPRAKERRKFGLKKARKAPQWSKR